MNNSNPTRTNISDLRRRLLTAPGNRTVPVPVVIEPVTEPILPPSLARRLAESARSSPTVIAPVAEAPAVADLLRQVGRRTPLPGVALQANHFLNPSGDPSGAPAVPAAVQNKNPQEEIAQLRQTLNDVQPILEEAQAQEQAHLESDQQLRNMIEERDQIMSDLEEQISQLQKELIDRPIVKNAEELTEWEHELERESTRVNQDRRKLDEERRQMQEDEDDLEKQMRDVEVSMARERAMMARQEIELKRLSAEIQQEIEQISRGDATLREQMMRFQRRHQEILARGAGLTVHPQTSTPIASPPVPTPAVTPAKPVQAAEDKKESSLFKRIFRK